MSPVEISCDMCIYSSHNFIFSYRFNNGARTSVSSFYCENFVYFSHNE